MLHNPKADATARLLQRDQATIRNTGEVPNRPSSGPVHWGLLCPDWRPPTFVVEWERLSLLHANEKGRLLLAEGQPLILVSGCLELASELNRERLARLLGRLAAQGDGAISVVGAPSGSPAFSLRVVGLSGDLMYPFPDRAAARRLALVELSQATTDLDATALDALSHAYGLTPAETAVLDHLVHGWTVAEITAMRGVGLETVRHQCKSVLAKTGCRRQVELVRLVLGLCGHA